MNSLDRAKRFLAAKTAKIALVAVPLAIAVPATFAQTSSGLNVSGFGTGNTCTVSPGSGTCAVESQSSQGGNPAFNEVDIYSTSNLFPSNGSLGLFSSGSASGTLPSIGTSFPVSWDFNIFQQPSQLPSGPVQSNITGLDVTLTWSLFSNLGTFSTTQTLNDLGTGNFTGSTALTIGSSSGSSSPTLNGYGINMQVVGLPAGFFVTVPKGASIDLNTAATATPEPGTFALGGLGLLGLLRLRRRKA